jgi:hypothetical protein
MNILKILFSTLIFLFISDCSSQENNIDNIKFNYSSARRIPFNNVKIQIYKRASGKSAFAVVNSEPGNNDTKWQYSKIDTIYDVGIEKFNDLKMKVALLEKIDLGKAYEDGADGNTCKIEFGAKGRNVSYEFWVPKSETKKRGLDEFVEICQEILILVKLNPKEILE